MKTNNFLTGRATHAGRGLLVLLFAGMLSLGASAQRGHVIVGGGYHYYPRTYVGVGVGFYGPYYPYYGFYNPWWGPYPAYYGYGAMPYRLAMQIEDIKKDYSDQISAVRADKSMTKKERRERVRELKHERDNAIEQAKHDYIYGRGRNNNGNAPQPYKGNDNNPPQQQNNNNKPGSNQNGPQSGPQSTNNAELPEYTEKGS